MDTELILHNFSWQNIQIFTKNIWMFTKIFECSPGRARVSSAERGGATRLQCWDWPAADSSCCCCNQSQVSIMCGPITDQYCNLSTNHSSVFSTTTIAWHQVKMCYFSILLSSHWIMIGPYEIPKWNIWILKNWKNNFFSRVPPLKIVWNF